MSKDSILHGIREESWTRERCFVRELINNPSIAGFSLAEIRVEPGVTTELHELSVDEWYVITAGSGAVEVGGTDPCPVGPGDVIPIPAGTSQRIENTGESDLVFQCVCVPRFTADAYRPLKPV